MPILLKGIEIYIFQYGKSRRNCEVLPTSIYECYNSNLLMEKDVEELEEKIVKIRMVKF